MRKWLQPLRGAKARAPRRYFFAVHNRNHVRLFAGAAGILAAKGHECTFITLEDLHFKEGAPEALARRNLAAISLAEVEARLSAGDTLVVGNDWTPRELRSLLEDRRERGLFAVGYVDGCRFTDPVKYRRVDHVLGWGPSSTELFPVPVTVVGHPEIEAAAQRIPRFAEPAFAIVNDKFTYGWRPGREAWTDAVLGACEATGIPYRVSRHPSDPDDPLGLPNEPMRDLIRDGSVLITRPSTTMYEAMAAGKPIVFFPTPDEELGEFAQPMGAYDIVHSAAELPRFIRQALAERGGYQQRARPFLERHVSIEPGRPALERIAHALAALARRGQERARRL
ncbi:MAG TPA: hypothetical protein VIF14_11335 [Alphaproteobacteria bacterium]|jgi:hypothetical protein